MIRADGGSSTTLIWRGRRIGYPQLSGAADVVARELAEAGVRPGMVVPVVLPRGAELVAVLLGIERLGAAYAVLDARWPASRVQQLASLLDAPVAVASAPVLDRPMWTPVGLWEPRPSSAPAPAGPRSVVAVFFTSGSSGTPKAVPVTRAAIAGLMRPGGMPVRLDASTVMAVAAPPWWDVFGLELWGPALNGGTCVLAEGDFLTPSQVRQYVEEYGLNTVQLTSSLFNLFVEEDLGAFGGVGQVVTGGEVMSPDHAREFLRAHPDIRLFNCYGPAENGICSTVHPVTLADCALPGGVPIGRPVGGTRAYVLDGERVCGPGEPGEICLAGARLSPGYLGDPAATGRAFGTVDLDGVATRVYRTGDLGRQDEHGVFHFRGRADRQVKVRGHRVEPAEIERVAGRHPAVAECVVVPTPAANSGGTIELVGCCRARGPLTDGELRTYLRERLPEYLVPGRWLRMDRIPRLDNGKVDVRAVRTLVERDTRPAADTEQSADPVIGELRALARATLGVDGLSADASLVEAGADSLRVIRLCLRAARRYGVDLDPADVLAVPTLTRLAELVRAGRPVERTDSGRRHALAPTQSAMLVTEVADPANRQAWHCTLVWRCSAALDVSALRRAVTRVHRRHRPLHARYQTAPPFASAESDPPTAPDFSVVTYDNDADRAAGLDLRLNAPFDLANGPAWRAVLALGPGPEAAVLGVSVHHVAFDGWSEHLLANELSAAYAAESCDHAVEAADALDWPSVRVPDDEETARRLRALAPVLGGTPPLVLPAPVGIPDGSGRPGLVRRVLDEAQAQAIGALAREHATTPFVVGLAGYAAAVVGLTGVTDFPVTVPVVRRDPANEDSIGCLLNLVCLRIRLDGAKTDGAALLDAAKRAARPALLTRDVPFAQAVGLLAASPRLGYPPVPHAFVIHQDIAPVLDLSGHRVRADRPAPHRAGFEFQLDLRLSADAPGEVSALYRTASVEHGFVEAFVRTFLGFVTSG
jgi:mycobactin peptide synthetase MbtE